MRRYAGLFLLSMAALSFEITLVRLFSVAQFYHFAFMIVSIALLGYGASGSILSVFPHLLHRSPNLVVSWCSLGAAMAMIFSYLVINWVPFDSFSIAWDRSQVALLIFHFILLATPFFFSGLAVGSALSQAPMKSHQIYAANLGGSALGCLVALLAPSAVGGEGSVVLSATMAAVAALATQFSARPSKDTHAETPLQPEVSGSRSEIVSRGCARSILAALPILLAVSILAVGAAELAARWKGGRIITSLELRLSPYKGLSYALQVPGAEVIDQRWSSSARLDLVRSGAIRSFPGLSFTYTQPLPVEDGLFIDGDDLSPVVQPAAGTTFSGFMPASVAMRLRPGANVLVLEPRGGLDALIAISNGARSVTAVEADGQVFAVSGSTYQLPQVRTVTSSGRSYARSADQAYDIVVLSLVNGFHPVRSGAYSLVEDYRYTVEAFVDYLGLLEPNGILVFTRWIQSPPSESLRAFATVVAALEARAGDPEIQVAAFRNYNTITFLVKNQPFTTAEIVGIREFSSRRSYDLVYLPGMTADEANRFNILPEPEDYLAFQEVVGSKDREVYYQSYPYAVQPATDDRPFFEHFFKWSQAPQVLAEFGQTWQPFGGAGYFVLLALLLLAIGLAAVLILLPVVVFRLQPGKSGGYSVAWPTGRPPARFPVYFALIGLAFLLIEIPLIQSFILYLGNPAYAFALVVFSLLAASGVGSLLGRRLSLATGLALAGVYLVILGFARPALVEASLGWPILLRMVLVMLMLAPLGIGMGKALPGGIVWMSNWPGGETWVPWMWAINGSAAVISAILAALLALTWGFDLVLKLGMSCYLVCWLIVMATERELVVGPLSQ